MYINYINIVYYFFIFISGCFLGSFLKVVADRTVNGESIVSGRSKCESCNKILGPLNLIPVLSYIFQRGKCSSCGKKFSVLYPISELLTGFLYLSAAYFLDLFNNFNLYTVIYFIYLLIIISFLVVMIFSDISYYIIPDKVVYWAIGISFLFFLSNLIFDLYMTYRSIADNPLGKFLIQAGYLQNQMFYLLKDYGLIFGSALAIGLFFYTLIVVTKGKGMGGGDLKLGILIGLFNGFPNNILGIFLGFLFGSVISLFLIGLKKKTMKDIIPFGPFLIAGSLVALFFGTNIINWYLGLM